MMKKVYVVPENIMNDLKTILRSSRNDRYALGEFQAVLNAVDAIPLTEMTDTFLENAESNEIVAKVTNS